MWYNTTLRRPWLHSDWLKITQPSLAFEWSLSFWAAGVPTGVNRKERFEPGSNFAVMQCDLERHCSGSFLVDHWYIKQRRLRHYNLKKTKTKKPHKTNMLYFLWLNQHFQHFFNRISCVSFRVPQCGMFVRRIDCSILQLSEQQGHCQEMSLYIMCIV